MAIRRTNASHASHGDHAHDAARTWYTIVNAAGEGGAPAELWIYDEIGYWGVSASSFTNDLRNITASHIDVRLNSPGGEVFDGIAIHGAMERHPAHITMYIDALAASAASFIAMAGDEIVIDRHAQMMIHDAAGFMFGNAKTARELADQLDKASDTIANIYAERSGVEAAFWRMAMVDETWYDANEAVAAGLATRVATPAKTRAHLRAPAGIPARNTAWDLSVYNYAGRRYAPAPRVPVAPVHESNPLAALLDQQFNAASTVDAASDPLAALKGA